MVPAWNTRPGFAPCFVSEYLATMSRTLFFTLDGEPVLMLTDTAPFPLVFQGMLGLNLTSLGKSTNSAPSRSSMPTSLYARNVVHMPWTESVSSRPICSVVFAIKGLGAWCRIFTCRRPWFKLIAPRPKAGLIVIDEGRIFQEIEARNPASVALNGPDGILPQVQDAAKRISKRYGIPAYVLADTTWGTCDLNTNGAKVLGAELQFNIGHTINTDSLGESMVLIDAYDDVEFGGVAAKCGLELAGKTVSLVTDSQHLHQVEAVKAVLEGHGISVKVGEGKGQLNDGQVFGCEFYPAVSLKSEVDAYVFLGQSNFHAAGVALSTGLPTYVLDPYFNEVREISEFAAKLRKKATLAIYKAAEAKTFGVIVGLKEGQLSKVFALRIKKELEELGKDVELFALTDITNERLQNLRGIDAFVQVACPRISTDNRFDRPVLSTPQANAMLRLLRGESIEGYLEMPHWL